MGVIEGARFASSFDVDDEANLLRLTFTKAPGLEVLCREVTAREYLAVLPAVAGLSATDPDTQLKALETAAALIVGSVVDWNVTRAGERVAPSVDALIELGFRRMTAVVEGWIDAQGGLDDPLGEQSGTGFDESTLPMEPTPQPL